MNSYQAGKMTGHHCEGRVSLYRMRALLREERRLVRVQGKRNQTNLEWLYGAIWGLHRSETLIIQQHDAEQTHPRRIIKKEYMKTLLIGLLFLTGTAIACPDPQQDTTRNGCPAGCYSSGMCIAGMFVGSCPTGETSTCAQDNYVCTVANFWSIYFTPCCCGSTPTPPVTPGPVDNCGGSCASLPGSSCYDCGAPVGWSCVTSPAMCGGGGPVVPGPGPGPALPFLPGPGPLPRCQMKLLR